MYKIKDKLVIAIFLIIVLAIIGVLGYHFLSGFSWIDALYMTVITATTVGFGEVHPLDDVSKLFTITLIIANLIIYGYGISIISEYMINGGFLKNIIQKRMENKIKRFNNHIILVGYGRNGKQALKKLMNYDKQVVIIENVEPHEKLLENNNIVFCYDDATDDKVLQRAGIEKASALISTLGTDTDNLFVVLSARQLNSKLNIISRASNSLVAKKLELAGANKIIFPHKIGGDYMASLLVTPDLVDFMQRLALEDRNRRTNLEEISFDDCPETYHNKTISHLNLRNKTGCTIIGFKTPDGKYIINPDANTKIIKGSNLIILGQPSQIKRLNALFDIK